VTRPDQAAGTVPVAGRWTSIVLQLCFWVPLAVCTYLALVPEPPEHPVFALSDVILHGAAFFYLTFALVLVQYGTGKAVSSLFVRTFVLMLAYGLLLEVVQSAIPERQAEVKDLLVDAAGILAGLGVAAVLVDPVYRIAVRLFGRF
jgi:VanZ family protein